MAWMCSMTGAAKQHTVGMARQDDYSGIEDWRKGTGAMSDWGTMACV